MALKEVALKEVTLEKAVLEETGLEEATLVNGPHGYFFKHWLANSPWVLFYFFFWFAYFSYFWLFVFEYNQQGGLTVGQANMWADWALHFTMGHAMAYRELFLEHSPLLLNHDFSYPFAINLISALLLKAGLSLVSAFVIPSYLFSLLLVYALYYFLNALLNHQKIAVIAAFLFFCNGGIGFYYFGLDIWAAYGSGASWLNAVLYPAKEYTHLAAEQIKWISVISSMILPQRSFSMGFGLTLLALGWLIKAFKLTDSDGSRKISQRYFFSAVILGLMPIIHMHSFLAAFIFLCCWSAADLIQSSRQYRSYRFKHWFIFAASTTVMALPILYFYYWGHLGAGFIKWYPGWYAKEFNMNWFLFWFKNWTIVPFLALLGLLMLLKKTSDKKQRMNQLALFLPAFILFAMLNLILLQPWIWDNTKLLVWVSLLFSALTAWCLFHFWIWKCHWPKSLLVLVLGLGIILSGFVDIYRNVRLDKHRYEMYSQTELELADWVKQNTPIDSIWLVSNKHNHWLFNLTGRQALMTYTGWLWSHGYNYTAIEKDAKIILKTANPLLLKKYQIDYVILDKQAIKQGGLMTLIFNMKFKKVKKLGQFTIFQTSY